MSNFHNNHKPGKILNNESSILLKPSKNVKILLNQFNNASPEDNIDTRNVVQSKYYNVDELQHKIPNKDKSLALFHIKACSLIDKFDDLQHLLSCTDKNLDVIAITENSIKKKYLSKK